MSFAHFDQCHVEGVKGVDGEEGDGGGGWLKGCKWKGKDSEGGI